MHDIGNVFEQQNRRLDLNNISARFAEFLVSIGENSLAGITYSFLIKLNNQDPKLVEKFATKALAIAKRQHDPIHIMARANDLKRVYKVTEPGSDRHIRALYDAKRALKDICKNYDSTQKRFHSITSKAKPIQQYQVMLASIKVELGKVLLSKDPNLAKEEFLTARDLFTKLKHSDRVDEINKLLQKL